MVHPAQLPADSSDCGQEAYGADAAQAQLSHAKLATTEGNFQPLTIGPDAREGLDRFSAGGESKECKYRIPGVSDRATDTFPLVRVRPKGFEPLTF